MPLLSFPEFSTHLSENKGRILGCDVGTKTIGLALSDFTRQIATPYDVVWRKQWTKDSTVLMKIIKDFEIVGVVVGFPLNMNGTEGPRCQSVRQFITNWLTICDLPFCLWDERLSTVAATRTLIDSDMSRMKRDKVVDKVAAAYILQGCLDALSQNSQV